MSIKRVGIVGSGIMGSGMAEVAAKAGFEVVLRSRAQATADAMVASLEKSLTKQVERGKLSEEELHELRMHANLFGQTEKAERFELCAPVIRHHHERWDGQGYPDGLHEDEIPLAARIIAVADTFDAVTSTRPYRPARTHRSAIAILDEIESPRHVRRRFTAAY